MTNYEIEKIKLALNAVLEMGRDSENESEQADLEGIAEDLYGILDPNGILLCPLSQNPYDWSQVLLQMNWDAVMPIGSLQA